MSDIEKMDLESKDLVADRIEQLKILFPEITVEGNESIDFDKLRLILGDDVDEGQERYAFTWPGKADAIRQAQTPSTATLRPDEDASVDWDTTENLYIEGDNLEALKLLQRGYHGKVKMIYIDPPYNTGHDFVYKDSFQDSIENYKEQAGLSGQSNADTSGRYHSDWLSMMYPRLRLARELLSNKGFICISIDDNEVGSLRNLMNEVFGESNFIAMIPRQSRASVQNDTDLSSSHEYVLMYAKTRRQENRRLKESNRQQWHAADSFACFPKPSDPSRYDNPDNDPRGPWKADPFDAPNVRPNLTYPITNPVTGEHHLPPQGRHWRTEPDKYEELMADNRIVFGLTGKGRPQLKVFFEEKKEFGEVDNTWWDVDRIPPNVTASKELMKLFDGKLPFDTPKPVELIENLIRLGLSLKEDDIVMDFFSGSAATAHAVMKTNQETCARLSFILVQLPEPDEDFGTLCKIGEERIRRAGQIIKAEIEEENKQLKLGEDPKPVPDIGFRVLKLDSSNFDQVEGGALVDNLVKPGRTNDDIIFEMMLKWGLELSLPMEKTEVAGYPVTSIAADELICCMDEGLTVEVLEAIAALEPKRVFFWTLCLPTPSSSMLRRYSSAWATSLATR